MNQPNQTSSKIAIVSASWHESIVGNAVTAAKDYFAEQDSLNTELAFFSVPGAFEIPLHAKRLAASGEYQAIIACGLVVDGGIYRHDFVASAVIDGLMQVQLENNVPVFSAVLTPHHFHEHDEHLKYFATHFVKKGQEVAKACVETLVSLNSIPNNGNS